jgi:outer membrane lipase/esterase
MLLLSVMVAALTLGKASASDLVVFGDSLSDPGNYFVETGESVSAPYQLVPDAPYTVGGHHFSNGRTWIEQLARRLHVPTSAGPALRSPGVFTNYAYGRSRARPNASSFADFDLGAQVILFLTDFGGVAPSDATYVLWTGSNDTRDALGALSTDPSGATSAAVVEAAITATANNMIALYGAGARNFLVLNVPNIAITPAVRALGTQNPVIPVIAEQLARSYNAGLSFALDQLEGLLPGVHILRLDIFALLDDIVADPLSAGLTDATGSCLTFGVVGGAICTQPNRYLFWDGTHPTAAGHAAVADAAAPLLAARSSRRP